MLWALQQVPMALLRIEAQFHTVMTTIALPGVRSSPGPDTSGSEHLDSRSTIWSGR